MTFKSHMAILGVAVLAGAGISSAPFNPVGFGLTTSAHGESAASAGFMKAMSDMMKNMMMTATGKPDLDFMQGMLPHHQGAVDMAKVELQHGKDPEMKALAQDIVKAQEAEIAIIKDWLSKTDASSLVTVQDSTTANKQAMDSMMNNMMMDYTGNADADFVKSMIPHHQGAVEMAKVAVQYAKDPVVLKLAQDVIKSQTKEVDMMNAWLKKQPG